MKSLARWGTGIVGQKKPDGEMTFEVDGAVVSRLELFKRRVLVGSEAAACDAVGIGGVWTASDQRRRGHATALMSLAVNQLQADGVQLGLLFSLANTVQFYERLGWTLATGTVTFEQPGVRMFDMPEHVHCLAYPLQGVIFLPDWPLHVEGLPW